MPLLIAGRAPEAVIEVNSSSPSMSITIDGRRTSVDVAPDGPNTPIINASVAETLGKKGSLIRGEHLVGHMVVSASSNMAVIDFGDGHPTKQRVFWFERNWSGIAEGRIGPGALPQDIVIFRLSETKPNEHVYTFPLSARGRAVLRSEIVVGKQTIPVVFTLIRPETMFTAATGALLAAAHNGRMIGATRDVRVEMGFSRPVRAMEFTSPVTLNGLVLRDTVVRTQDTGSTADIPDDGQDPNEIIVSAKNKVKPQYGIYVGWDSLSHCSALTFDKKNMEIRISCH